MSSESLNAGISDTDRAYSAFSRGETKEVINLALTILGHDVRNHDAVLVLSQAVQESDDADDVRALLPEVFEQLVDAYVRRGWLPSAAVAAKAAADAGVKKGLVPAVAKAFCKSSKRLGDGGQQPPPLPRKARPSAVPLGSAKDALKAFLDSEDPVADNTPLPRLPLFSALSAKALESFFEASDIVDLDGDQELFAEGDDGDAMYIVVRGMLEASRDVEGQHSVLAGLGPGALVGEMALVTGTPRSASIKALEPARLLKIDKPSLEALAQTNDAIGNELASFCYRRMMLNLLQTSEILSAVPPEERHHLLQHFETRHIDSDEILIEEGTDNDEAHLLASGEVVVEDNDGNAIARLGPGAVVGEISLVLRRPARSNVRTTAPTVLLTLAREQFEAAIETYPELLSKMYEVASKRERLYEQSGERLSQAGVLELLT